MSYAFGGSDGGAHRPEREKRPIVVLVDDEPAVLDSLKRLLRAEPYALLTTERPDQALEWVRRMNVRLVISDQRMPDMLGTELLDQVARSSPETRRVILTGYPGNTLKVQSLLSGIQDLIYKPWDDAALKQRIRLLLEA